MAVLFIAEFQGLGAPSGNLQQSAQVPPVAQQTLAIGVGSVASNAFNARTQMIRVHTDAICSIAFGAAPTTPGGTGSTPTATNTNMRLAANQTEYFAVYPGQIMAVITNT